VGVLSAAVEVVAPVSSDGVPAYPTRASFFQPGLRIRIGIQSGQWIRILIRNPDPDPEGPK
jgi:hypothetical protein